MLRHVLPSWNSQACSFLHFNYMDPMTSGSPCGELGNITAISLALPPSTVSSHTCLTGTVQYCGSFPSGVNSDHIGRNAHVFDP